MEDNRRRPFATDISTSRALFESSNTTALQQHRTHQGVLKDLKVYIYDLPSKYNSDWLSNERCSNHCLLPSTVNGFPAIGHARRLLASAVQLISSDLPFWNRSRGSDHVFVASHDYGACFHAMEDVAIADGIPEFLKKSIILQTFGARWKFIRRTSADVFTASVYGPLYGRNIGADRRFYLKRHRFAGYQTEIGRSVFCLCPLGWAPWSPRLVESVALGCVPVIIADGLRLPFHAAVRWSEVSLTVAEKDVGKLGSILEHVAATNLSTIQRNLWDPAIRRALLFNDRMIDGDATWQVLDALAQKLNRSHRRSRVSSELKFDT
ncbi:hypothetical protein F0562_002008 [Nyssa sinensis]|uniref:Exostosin GT47 domain-containing protein n=1 Tax=Nyssa sinensis TaxID=561372 RepID=A0A5J5C670_9ASTE|nr:hypothetical protein F0562_002008 [Nyssa sinensis]